MGEKRLCYIPILFKRITHMPHELGLHYPVATKSLRTKQLRRAEVVGSRGACRAWRLQVLIVSAGFGQESSCPIQKSDSVVAIE